jgi:hypothetical protein
MDKMPHAPIAGANYLANTKNYPWHRPPDIVDYDEGVDYILTKLKEPEQQEMIFALMEIDTHVSTIVSSLILQSISKGKFATDLGVLMAGPIARYISIIADAEDIKYNMGTSDDGRAKVTPTSLKVAMGIMDEDDEPPAPKPMPQEPDIPEGGLMGKPTPDEMMTASDQEQAAMLGMTQEEEEQPNGMA